MKKIFYVLGLLSLVLSVTANGGEKKLPKLLDLGAKKCIPCKKMAPILEQMEKEFKGVLDVEFIDVWQPENKEKATKHKIETIPTQIFFDANGKELWRHIGFISKEDMLNKWKELGYEFKVATFVNQDNLKKWLEKHPLETGKEITINQALADKMKLKKEQIQKACKIGECSPK